MSRALIKATYQLDAVTIRKLDDLARRRGVTTSEALRAAVTLAAVNGHKRKSNAVKALTLLQDSLKLTGAGARAWESKSRAERRASSSRATRRR